MTKISEIVALEQRMRDSHNQFNQFFAGFSQIDELQNQVERIQQYYTTKFNNCSASSSNAQKIVSEYENLVNNIAKVRSGEINADVANSYIDDLSISRKSAISLHNIAKACEIAFWISLAVVEIAAITLLAIPLFVIDPFTSIVATTGMFFVYCATLDALFDAFKHFTSFKAVNDEKHLEKDVVSFFAGQRPNANLAAAVRDEAANELAVDEPPAYPQLSSDVQYPSLY